MIIYKDERDDYIWREEVYIYIYFFYERSIDLKCEL